MKKDGSHAMFGILFPLLCLILALGAWFVLSRIDTVQNSGNGPEAHGALWVDGTQLRGQDGETVVLRGLSSHGISWYPRFLNGAAMETLKENGANLLRLSMYSETSDGYLEKPEENLNYLYMSIETALVADLYVIVDWHILTDGNPNTHIGEALEFFQEISSHYGNHPGILYEICNEPNGDTSWDDVVSYANLVIPQIRANAPDAIILVGTPNYCTDFSGPLERPLSFSNIMYTMHCYIDTGIYKPCDVSLIDFIVQSQLPVFVSEWGTGLDAVKEGSPAENYGDFQENAQPFLDYMAEHHISWAAWALSNKDESHSVIRSDCNKLSGWTESDLTSFGKLVFDNLGDPEVNTSLFPWC